MTALLLPGKVWEVVRDSRRGRHERTPSWQGWLVSYEEARLGFPVSVAVYTRIAEKSVLFCTLGALSGDRTRIGTFRR